MADSVNLYVAESREPSQQEDSPDEWLTTTIESRTSEQLRQKIRRLQDHNKMLENKMKNLERDARKLVTSQQQEIEQLNRLLADQQNKITILENELIRRNLEQRCKMEDWIIGRKDVIIDKAKPLGQGSLGTVYRGTFHNSPVAVKELHRNTPNNAELLREINVAVNCHHPNVLQIMGVTNDNQSPLIVMELLNCSLRYFIEKYPKDQQSTGKYGKCLALGIAQGLCYLHSKDPPVVHRDIKTDNILLKEEGGGWKAKVGDFGTAKVCCKKMTPNRGTLAYAAPEAHTDDQQSPKMDVYSFGVVLMEMQTGELPDVNKIHEQIEKVDIPKLKELIQWCTRVSPAERPTMKEVIDILKKF